MTAAKGPTRKPDWRVSTPSQIDPDRWVDIGAAWSGETESGQRYMNVQLDVMPVVGRLTLFPWSRDSVRSCDDKIRYSSETAAANAARALNAKAGTPDSLEGYHCERCGRWHVSRKSPAVGEEGDAP